MSIIYSDYPCSLLSQRAPPSHQSRIITISQHFEAALHAKKCLSQKLYVITVKLYIPIAVLHSLNEQSRLAQGK